MWKVSEGPSQKAAQYLPKEVVQGKCPLHFNGIVCSKALFSNTSALTSSRLYRSNSTRKGSRRPRLVEHFWGSNLGASCSNKQFVGTLWPSHALTRQKKQWYEEIAQSKNADTRTQKMQKIRLTGFICDWLCVTLSVSVELDIALQC